MANLDKPSITSYAPNPAGVVNEAPLGTIFGTNTGLEDPEGLAIDATGHLYVVANHLTGSIITVYAADPSGTINETPIATIAGSNTGLGQPAGIALDASGRIYVTNGPLGGAPSITVYPANPRGTLNEAPLATITGSNTQLTGAEGLSVDANGKIYVANSGTNAEVVVFPAIPSAGGLLDEAPQAVITGPSTGLKNPYDVVVDPSGVIYVVDSIGGGTGAGSIDLFAANPSGFLDEAPIAEITGATTDLFGPGFLALDPSGKIYVSDPARQSIFVYPAHPTGTLDEAPIATIAGSNTGLSAPYGIVVP